MKRLFLFCALVICATILNAEETPSWLRNCSISPDGATIAFTYKSDIFTVSASGGEARQLTSNNSYDTAPIWSPDGKHIAFASTRNGSMDIYIVSKEGGTPKRLTTNSASERPIAFLNDKEILFSSNLLPTAEYGEFPRTGQIYKVSTEGGRPVLFSSENMEAMSIDKKGRILYHDNKGYEDPWRKHHTSSIARDIWIKTDDGKPKYTKLTTFEGEDRNPVWSSENDTYYYLSERNGSFNVFKASLSGNKNIEQITRHSKHPVRFLTTSKDDKLCYCYNGDIYIADKGKSPQKVDIRITADIASNERHIMNLTNGATAIAVSKSGKEVAFIVRGDVFVTMTDHNTTRRITDTPEQERNIDISPDGRTIIYSSERNGVWGIYKTSIVREEDKYFTHASELKEESVVTSDKASFQPSFSPDGKEIAFLEERTTLRVINLDSKRIRTVLDGKYNYSYSDGDISYAWSPDSKWFLTSYIGIGGWNNTDIALVKADGKGEIHNLTESGYTDANARWALDGKAMIWSSDRAGYRSHGSWGAQRDEYIMFFDGAAYDKFRMNKEELELFEEEEKAEKEKAEKAKKEEEEKSKDKKKEKSKKKDDKKESDDAKQLKFDLENRKDRIIRLTTHSSSLGDAVLSKKGDKLYYLTRFEGSADLWERNMREGSDKIVAKGFGYARLLPDKETDNIYAVGNGIKRFSTKDNQVKHISFNAEFIYKPLAEREYIFDHVWRQVKDKFYDANLHGIDWEFYGKEYRKFLPHINSNVDFAELLSELLGELNASHTGARSGIGSNYHTAVLGAFYDESHKGDGLKIKEIIRQSPLLNSNSKIKNGCIIEKINGTTIEKGKDYFGLLENKAGKKVLLSVYDPESKKHFEAWVKPITQYEQNTLLYKRWVERKRALVDSLSNGRIGYIHIKGMDSESFRNTYSELLGRYRNHEAVLIDTRHNGGGWLHEDLAILLSGKEYQRFTPRGQYIGSDPFNQWCKPSAVLVCENNYSNAHGFPSVYKSLGIGKLIGAPVPGTMTAVWWETQIDPSIVFGVPQTTVVDIDGNVLENRQLEPDIKVYNSPEEREKGIDAQIKAGVRHLLSIIDNNK